MNSNTRQKNNQTPLKKISHQQLVEIAYKWVLKNGSCGFAAKEIGTISSEIPDVIGFVSGSHSVLIECKASRSDFLKDKHKLFRQDGSGMGLFRIYCCPVGIIKPEDLPEKWGLIHITDEKQPIEIVNPLRQENKYINWTFSKNDIAERAIMYSMLRRLKSAGSITEFYKNEDNRRKERKALLADLFKNSEPNFLKPIKNQKP